MKKLIATATALGASLYFAVPAYAATMGLCPPNSGDLICNLTIGGLIVSAVQFILILAFLLAFAFLVFGGIKWIISGGDKAGTEAAKGTLTAALIGLIVVLVAWALINFLGSFFGYEQDLPKVLNSLKIQKTP